MKTNRPLLMWMMLAVTLMSGVSAIAQNTQKLSAKAREELCEQAKTRVTQFEQSCAIIASDIPYAEKVKKNGEIDMAMKHFAKELNPHIEITSLNGKSNKKREIREYLERLAKLRRDYYKSIQITWYNLAIGKEFKYDTNTKMYVGTVKVTQRFSAVTHEMIRVEDQVVRTAKVYATLDEYREKNRQKYRWRVFLGDIKAKNIQN